jgi:hypothetical protein
MNNKIDIWSKGEVVRHLSTLVDEGQILPCKHISLEYGHAEAYYPRCNKKWASRVSAKNVPIDITAYNGPSSYHWPQCPQDCPHFQRSEDFQLTASRDQFDAGIPSVNTDSEESKPISVESTIEQPVLEELQPPTKVTIGWLVTHVDWKHWVAAIVLLVSVFVAGAQSTKLTVVQEVFGIKIIESKSEVNNSSNTDGDKAAAGS